MKTIITRIKRLALALCFVTPLVSWAATITGYEDFGDVAGVVLWRATQTTFHNSTVINVANDGTLGTAYAMDAGDNNTTSWKRFASNQGSSCYTSPGTVLVYDKASSDDETPVDYTQNSEPDFGPLSFGGLWVQTLAANGSPFKLADSGSRATEFGNASYSGTTLFKFDKSFTIDRQGTFSFLGTVNLAVAQDAVFTINQSYPAQSIVVPAGSTLVPTGAGTITLNTAGLTVNGTLDLTASTLPTISGNVRFAGGSSLVLPEGIVTGEPISVAVCSGTLTADGVVSVKIGSADPINAALTISGGAITQIDEAVVEQTFTSDYPSVVPAGYIYTFTTSAATTLPSVTVNGTLKTEGDFTITDLKVAASGAFEVVSGNTTVGGAAIKQLSGNITVRSSATLTNTLTDSLNYSGSMTVDIYGTLAMGATRWSIPDGCTFKVRGGATVTGTGDGCGVLDFLAANDRGLDVYAASSASSVTIEGAVRVRNNNTRIWVASGTTLVLQSGIVEKNQEPGSFKQTGPGTLQLDATSTTLTGTSIMTQGTLCLNNTTQAFPLALQGNNSHLEIVATSAETIVPVNVTSIANNNVALTGSGKANGTITKTAAPSGDLASFLQSSAWEGTFVADWAGAHDTRFDINSYGNANSTVRVTKLVGGYVSGSNANVTVVPTVEVRGFMTLGNGYSGKVTTLTKLTGSGVFTNTTYSVDVTTLDNFTGTLATLIGTQYVGMKIGTINLSATPAAGDKIVNITSDSNIGNIGNTKVSVNGVVDDTIALEVKSDGIYVAEENIDVTVPVVANTVVTVTVGGETVSPKTEGGNVYAVAPGSVVTVTYAAAEGYKISGTTEYTVDTASATTFEITDTATAQYVAQIKTGATTYEKYTTLADALNSGNAAYGITLLADVTETAVVVDSTASILGNYTINSNVTIADGGLLQLQAALNGTLTIQGGGTYVPFGGTLGNVVVQDGGIINLTKLSEDAASLTVPTLTVNGALTIVSSYGLAERGKTYKAISYVTENATIAEGASFNGKDEWSASTTVDGDYTVVCLEITKVAVVNGVYYDTAQEAVDAAVASGEPAQFLVQPGTVTLGAGETLVVTGGYQPTVTLESGLTTPPYEITSGYDPTSFVCTYTVNDVAPILYFNTWSVPNVFYFADEDPVPSRTTQGTVPKIKREGDSAYHAAEDWVTITWTVTASSATDASTPDDTIATVDENGLVTFTAPGTVKVWLTMTDPSGATKSASKTVKYAPAPAVVVSADGQTKTAYSSLYAAFNGAATSEKIVLGADATVGNIGKMELKDGRSITLDLDGHTVTFNANYGTNVGSLFNIKSGSLAVVDTGATKGGIAATGTGARVFSMETADEATTALSIGEGVNVSSAHEVCVYLQGAATLTTAGNLTAASDFAIAGNGSSGNGGTTVNVTGGTVTGDEIAIYQPQNGALTISGGAITGGTAVYVKSGTVSVTGGTITGNGAAADYVFNGSGANVTGDAIVIDNAGYPGGAHAPSITGGTFISVNASAIASYSKSGYSRITKFAAASLKTSSITEAVASSADVFDDYSSGIDPTDPTSTQEVTVDTSLTAEEQEAAAIEAATVTVPDGVSGVDAPTYKTYFTYSATPTETAGTYTVAITGLADEVTETADGNALAALEAATAGGTLSAEVAVKPGLYYGTVAGADVTTLKAPAGTLNTTGKLDLSGVTKPSTGEAFFIKIKVGTTAFAAEE